MAEDFLPLPFMKSNYILTLFLFCFLNNCAKAQTNINQIVIHKTIDFKKDPKLKWMNIREHKLPSNVNYEPQLFLWLSVDTSNFRKDENGYKYFKSKLYFGFNDQDELYEVSEAVYAGTGNKFRTHSLMWRYNSFYLLTNDLIDAKHRNVILYRLDKNKILSSAILNNNPIVGNYAKLGYDDQHGSNYVNVSYLNTEKKRLENIYFKENIYKFGTQELDTTIAYTTNKDIEIAKNDKEVNPIKYYADVDELAAKWYAASSNPDYDHKQYLLDKKVILIKSPIRQQYEQNGVTKFSTSTLQNAEKNGWTIISDLHNRNTTSLFFHLKTDSTNFKTDSKKRRYFKTFIRFGFAEDEMGYQLPDTFYIQEKQNEFISLFNPPKKISFKNPCLMFSNESFYVFIPNYNGEDKQDALMFTYYVNKGLVKEVLWKGKVTGSSMLPYFTQDNENNFALIHSDEDLHNLTKTYQEKGNWHTISIDLNVYQPILENKYKEQIQPYYLPLNPEPFVRPYYVNDKFFNPILTKPVFTNSREDQSRYQNLLNKKDNAFYSAASINDNKIVYDNFPHSRLLIPFIPKRQQNYFIQCLSYAYASLYKQAIDADWQITEMRKIDPKALLKETDVSYFGMQ
jgi:hypothetical protein